MMQLVSVLAKMNLDSKSSTFTLNFQSQAFHRSDAHESTCRSFRKRVAGTRFHF